MPEIIDVYPKDSGKILKELLKAGKGETVPFGASVTLHYTGSLPDGTKFDSSKDRDGPFRFNVGKGAVIAGLDIAICSMRKEEHAIFLIDPEYAYGAEGYPPSIPPNVVLKFNVHILEWEYEDLSVLKDTSVERRHTTEPGVGYVYPTDGAYVHVHIKGTYESEVFEDRYALIEPLEEKGKEEIAEGIRIAVKKLRWGEQATIFIHPEYAEEAPCFKDKDLSIHGTVEYDVKVICFEKTGNWSNDENEKVEISEVLKERGNQYFKNEEYDDALRLYERALGHLLDKDDEPVKMDEACSKLIQSTLLNASLCHLKKQNYEKAKELAFRAISKDSQNDKAHYRCGMALLALSYKEKARDHFMTCLKINPNNQEAKSRLAQTTEEIKKRDEDEKKRYRNMFEKFAEMDVEKREEESQSSKS